MSAEGTARSGRVYHSCTSVGNADLLPSVDEDVDRSPNDSSGRRHSVDSGHQENPSINEDIAFDSMPIIRESYKGKNISTKSTNIILQSWRRSTKKQYVSYLSRWFRFCHDRQISSVQTDLGLVLDFLTELYDSGCGYNAINTTRSALSAIGIVKDGVSIGSHPVVIRYMKGIYNLRPSVTKYCETWDVSKVLHYLIKLSPIRKLSLRLLTLKLCMLIALTLASRVQSIYLLDIKNIRKCYSSYILHYSGLLKQTKAGVSNPVAELKAYPPDRRLCTVFVLKEYLRRTEILRGDVTCLFISYIKPHKAVTRDTISRWLRTVMENSGIDIGKFKSHSIRSASASRAKEKFVPVEDIMKTAGWSSSKTFAQFYDKPIKKSTYSEAVLEI